MQNWASLLILLESLPVPAEPPVPRGAFARARSVSTVGEPQQKDEREPSSLMSRLANEWCREFHCSTAKEPFEEDDSRESVVIVVLLLSVCPESGALPIPSLL